MLNIGVRVFPGHIQGRHRQRLADALPRDGGVPGGKLDGFVVAGQRVYGDSRVVVALQRVRMHYTGCLMVYCKFFLFSFLVNISHET